MLAKSQNEHATEYQTMMCMYSLASGTSCSLFNVLNHAGITLSYTQAVSKLRKLSAEQLGRTLLLVRTQFAIHPAWMKIFEEQAHVKANGLYRLVIVDSHNSHYTVAFLLLTCLHQVSVLCYPAHGTHIYQGLNVVIFAILKLLLSKECDKLLQDTGTAINKSKFLSFITNAYVQALTPGNIKTTFRKTGIHPFNPDVVTSDMLAPSKETSLEANLHAETSDAAKTFADTLCRLQDLEEEAESGSEDAE